MDADAYKAGIVEAYESELRKKDAEIERLRGLCGRAADALEISKPRDSLVYNELIAELRKAAK